MKRNKALTLYLSGSLGQIAIICMMVFVLRRNEMIVDYTSPMGMAAIGVGGVSSALWGIIVAIKYKKYELKKIVKEFFDVKQAYSSYLFAVFFLLLDFFAVFFHGELMIEAWYIPLSLFLKALIFGGIEEIGWRYIFQPALQERFSYFLSTLMTFGAWGIWHFMYFYIEGTVLQVNVIDFLAGLLTSCFMLSALYIKTKSLWICVMTHALFNVFSQITTGGSSYVSYLCKIIIILIAVVLSTKKQE